MIRSNVREGNIAQTEYKVSFDRINYTAFGDIPKTEV